MKFEYAVCLICFCGLSFSTAAVPDERPEEVEKVEVEKDSRTVVVGQDCSAQWQVANNPCANNPLNKVTFPLPTDSRKFVECGPLNRMFIIQCPPGEVYSQASSACVSQSAIIAQPTVNIGSFGITNPCTAQNIQAGRIFFGIQADNTKFIECDANGNAIVLTCTSQMIWDQSRQSCIFPVHTGFVIPSGTGGIAGVLPQNPCTVQVAGSQTNLFFSHPDPTKFIQCDLQGNAFVHQCPSGLVWNQYLETCVSQVAGLGGATQSGSGLITSGGVIIG